MQVEGYELGGFFDELFAGPSSPRPQATALLERLTALPDDELRRCQLAAQRAQLHGGITFRVAGDTTGVERILPFDIVPRILDEAEWSWIDRGLRQRVAALNAFIDDVYHRQRILRDGAVPREIVVSSAGYRPQCIGLNPPRGVWCHIIGVDLVRDGDGQIYVLEDNLRTPSGVSYVLENRRLMKQTFSQLFEGLNVRPVEDYPSRLLEILESLASPEVDAPRVVVLTPGPHNSAYFEHSFLAQQMGVELVQGSDLTVDDGLVQMRTTSGLQPVDVIYRRIDDDFLDPLLFRSDSLLGVPGLMNVYRHGRLGLANAPGTGVADDKAVYTYVPEMIRYYLGEDPILPNVPTYVCSDDTARQHVLDHVDELVVKATNESGGYGMLVGPSASSEERDEFRRRIEAAPRNYIAQPMLALSRLPTFIEGQLQGRHVDLRPFVLMGRETYVLPGGLTRVALRAGSLVVNSSQGGGSKDTWVLGAPPARKANGNEHEPC
jgi:uncharacterized circularly permuted ATP-grasp superfamily protein